MRWVSDHACLRLEPNLDLDLVMNFHVPCACLVPQAAVTLDRLTSCCSPFDGPQPASFLGRWGAVPFDRHLWVNMQEMVRVQASKKNQAQLQAYEQALRKIKGILVRL